MDVVQAHMPWQRTTGIHRLSFYGSVTIRQRARATLPARRRTSHGSLSAALQLLLVQQLLWSRALVGRQGTVAAYGSRTTHVASEATGGRDGLSLVGDKARRRAATAAGNAEVSVSGRHDVSGCLWPCLIAYYDLCFLGTDTRSTG